MRIHGHVWHALKYGGWDQPEKKDAGSLHFEHGRSATATKGGVVSFCTSNESKC